MNFNLTLSSNQQTNSLHVQIQYQMMTKRIFALFCVTAILACVNASWLKNLSDSQQLQNGLQQNTKKVWLLYRGNSHTNVIEDVAQVFRGMIQVAILDKAQGQGSLQLVSDDRAHPIQYNGGYDVDQIVKFVLYNIDDVVNARSEIAKDLKANQQFQLKQIERAKKQWDDQQSLRKKSDSIILTVENWKTFSNDRQSWVINFYEANCSACINLNKEWELIATSFKGKVKVAKINITEPGNQVLEEQIQLQKYPSIRFYKNGPKKVSQFSQFEGVHKRFSIQEWLNSKLGEKSTQVQIPRLNKQNYEAMCKSTKNTCIIVFTEDEDAQTLKSIQNLSLKHLKKPITFVLSKKGEQDAFAKQVGVSSYPETVMVYCKQKKIWRMGGLNFTVIDDAIGQISLGNRNNFIKYTFGQAQLK